MRFSIILRLSQLKVASALLINIAAGLLLSALPAPNYLSLLLILSFAMILIILAVRIEDILYDQP